MRWSLIVPVLLAGCGGEQSGLPPGVTDWAPPDAGAAPAGLNGTWISPVGQDCARGLTFDTAKGTYVEQFLCPLADSAFGDEMQLGAAQFPAPGSLAFLPEKVSCAAHAPVRGTVNYSLSASQLSLAFSDSILIFTHTPTSTMPVSGTLQLGCWETSGFTQHALEPAP